MIAATLLAIMLTNTLAPTVTYALTSGPAAPEATSFELVDTTDMVNLQTGDFTYNIPLIEVPGPEGGYPLSLSYHAGIQPNEDASWAFNYSTHPNRTVLLLTTGILGFLLKFPLNWIEKKIFKHEV